MTYSAAERATKASRAGKVVHRLRMSGIACCGVREFEPGKPKALFTTKARGLNCPACIAVRKGQQEKAKAESKELIR